MVKVGKKKITKFNKTLTLVFIVIIAITIILSIFLYSYVNMEFTQKSTECQVECGAKGWGWSACKFSLQEGCYCWKPKLWGLLGHDCIKIW